MTGFGSTLRMAREQKGLSVEQVSAMTRLSPTMIELLERDDFSMVPAPLYGRGFVKLFAQAVGLDPKPLIEVFMQLYGKDGSGAKSSSRSHEPVAHEAPPVTRPLSEPSRETAAPAAPKEIPPSRYAAPRPLDERPSLTTVIFAKLHLIPSHVWRLSALALGGAILVTLIFFGVRALYRATSADPEAVETEETVETEVAADERTPSAAAPVAGQQNAAEEKKDASAGTETQKPRRGTVIEPLYVD